MRRSSSFWGCRRSSGFNPSWDSTLSKVNPALSAYEVAFQPFLRFYHIMKMLYLVGWILSVSTLLEILPPLCRAGGPASAPCRFNPSWDSTTVWKFRSWYSKYSRFQPFLRFYTRFSKLFIDLHYHVSTLLEILLKYDDDWLRFSEYLRFNPSWDSTKISRPLKILKHFY